MVQDLILMGVLSLVSGWGAPLFPANALVKAQATEAPAKSSCRIWVEPGASESGERVGLDIQYLDEYLLGEPLAFDCTAQRRGNVDKVLVRLVIRGANGKALHEGEVLLSLWDGQEDCQFRWDASGLPTGVYTARFEWRDRPEFLLGWSEHVVRKVSLDELEAALAQSDAAIRQLVARLDDLAAEGQRPPYARVQVAMARDFVALAKEDLARGNWRRVDLVLRYLQATEDSVRASLAFGQFVPELSQPIPQPDLSTLEARDGAFYAGGRPVFLLGWGGIRRVPEEIARIRRYGLNLAAIEVAPHDTLLSDTEVADVPAMLSPLFQRAEENNVSIMVNLNPAAMPQWAIDRWAGMSNEALGGVDVTCPEARALIERHFTVVLPYLAEQKVVNSVCLLDRPAFRFDGDRVRQGFLAKVKELYPDRHALNRSWRAHLASFDHIDISRDHLPHEYQEKRAFRYDWQTYHRQLGSAYITWLVSLARELAPELRVHVKFADTMFDEGESRLGVDHETLVHETDLSACTAAIAPYDPHYALAYPHQALTYAFLQSLAPDKPVFDLEERILPSQDCAMSYNGAFVHSAMWEAAVAGLSAAALGGWDAYEKPTDLVDNILVQPECLEGYARACLDLNRLADLVVAFQSAPADVAILWSLPSKILDDGDPYLSSTRDAFEGCSFSGYKVRFITQQQCVDSGLAEVKVLVIPETPALNEETFKVVQDYVAAGGVVARLGTPIPYNERGHSRHDSVGTTPRTVLVKGVNLPTEYLHAMDAVLQFDVLEPIPRAVNPHGFPLEGVRTRYVDVDDTGYLYLLNLRKEPVRSHLVGQRQSGRDLILGRDVVFPMTVEPLDPMLIRLEGATEHGVAEPEGQGEALPEEPPVIELTPAPTES